MTATFFWKRLHRVAAGAALLSLFAFPARTENVLVLSNVTIVDPSASSADTARQPGRSIVIRNGRIIAVQPSDVALPDGARVVDGGGKFAVPAFWDVHAHVLGDLKRARAALAMQFANGVLYMRDMGTDMPLPELQRLKADTVSGDAPRVRIVATPYGVVNGRNPRNQGASGEQDMLEVESVEDVRSLLQFVKRHEIDFLKPYDALSLGAYRALISQARKAGLSLSGHIPRQVSVTEAVESGQATVEHAQSLTWACAPGPDGRRRSYYLGDPARRFERNPAYPGFASFVSEAVDLYEPDACKGLLHAMAERGVSYVPTLVTRRFDALASFREYREDPLLAYIDAKTRRGWTADAENYAGLAPDVRVGLHRFLLHAMKITGEAYRAGVPILVGSDSPDSYIFPGFSYHLEMEMLAEAGLPPLAVLQSATVGAARFMKSDKDYGTIAPGKVADIVVLDADPLSDIRNVRKIRGVFVAGTYADRAELDAMLSNVRAEVLKINAQAGAQ